MTKNDRTDWNDPRTVPEKASPKTVTGGSPDTDSPDVVPDKQATKAPKTEKPQRNRGWKTWQ